MADKGKYKPSKECDGAAERARRLHQLEHRGAYWSEQDKEWKELI